MLIHRVRRCIELGLADIPEDSSDEEEVPEYFDETIQTSIGWVDFENDPSPPALSLDNIHHFFVTKCLKRDEVTACKLFEKGYRIYHSKKVNSVSSHHVSDHSPYTIVRAAVMASQRDKAYCTCVAIKKNSGNVLHGHCTCTAGKSKTCNHVAALLFYIDNFNRTPLKQTPSCISKPCEWKKPAKLRPKHRLKNPDSDIYLQHVQSLNPLTISTDMSQ